MVNARGAPRTICSALQECVRHQGAVKSHVVWLKATHDVVAERQAFVKQLFFSLFAALEVVDKVPEPPKPQELALAAELKAQEEAAAKVKKEEEAAAAKRAAEDSKAGGDSSGDEAERREPGPAHDKDKQRAVEAKEKEKKKGCKNKGVGRRLVDDARHQACFDGASPSVDLLLSLRGIRHAANSVCPTKPPVPRCRARLLKSSRQVYEPPPPEGTTLTTCQTTRTPWPRGRWHLLAGVGPALIAGVGTREKCLSVNRALAGSAKLHCIDVCSS